MTSTLHVQLLGALSLTNGGGRDCTPRGLKARGLVALLAMSPGNRRSRRWLEGKLWSDRGPEQASGSLRQALVELRGSLGASAGRLVADRETVGLTGLTTDLDGGPDAAQAAFEGGRDLLEGLDLRDPAFERWLAEARARLQGSPDLADLIGTDQPALPFLIRPGLMPPGFGGFVALALAEAIGKLVSEFASIDIYGPNAAILHLGAQDRGLVLTIEASEADGRLHVITRIGALRTGQVFWSRQSRLPLHQGDLITAGEFPTLVFEAAEAALSALPRIIGSDPSGLQVDALVARAVREMFTFDATRLRHAETMLKQAAAILPSPRVFAWHGLLKQIMAIERVDPDRDALYSDAIMYARRAMEGASSNPLVLSLVSQVLAMMAGDAEGSAALARDAVAMSPSNAFAHAALSGSFLRQGKPEEALRAARRGAHLAARSGFLQWWESLSGLSSLAMGNHPAAIGYYEAARSRAPMFRPALRHLLFLYLDSNQGEKAAGILRDLQRIEPDFSLLRVREDPDYPAGTLRGTLLIGRRFPDLSG